MSAKTYRNRQTLRSFRKMKESDLSLWAAVLCHQPLPRSSQWSTYKSVIKEQISSLPEHLRAYPTIVQRFINGLQGDKARAEARNLCPLHDKLNRPLARSTLGWIKAEIDVNIPALLMPLYTSGVLDQVTAGYFAPLKEVSAMWTRPKKYQEAWGLPVKNKWVYQEDRCAACVLARFASDINVVTMFKAGLIARRLDEFRHGRPSRRLSYINKLLSHFPNGEGAAQRAERVGKHVQRAWEQFKKQTGGNDYLQAARESSVSAPMARSSVSPISPEFDGSEQPEQIYAPPSSSIYSPTPITPQSRLRVPRDDMSILIDHYRRTVYEPVFGHEDHSGFESDDPAERAALAAAMNWNEPQFESSEPVLEESSVASSQTRCNPYSVDLARKKDSRMTMRNTRINDFL